MKIAYVTAGAADMYCGSCLHDNTLAAALIARGHDCLLIPTYTPIRTDEVDVSLDRVFFGGVSVYLEQKVPLLRRMPAWLNYVLSRPAFLRWVSRFAVKTRPEDLGDLTISMLKGMKGFQRREVRRLVRWLASVVKPDVVCVTNALLSGFVPELKRRLNIPVLCALQGEDIFLDWLPVHCRSDALALIRANCTHFDGFLTTSRYYGDRMAASLQIPPAKIHVVYPGINLNGYDSVSAGAANDGRSESSHPGPLTIGYLARICPEKGLAELVEAFDRLLRMPGTPPCRLRVAGWLGERDHPYLNGINERIRRAGWSDRFEYVGEVDHAGKIRFLKEIDVFSVPTVYQECKGLYVMEAWAVGVPVVQPRHGAFPELIEATRGGLLVKPHDPDDLARGLHQLLDDEGLRLRLGQLGLGAVQRHFHAARMAEETLDVLRQHVEAAASARSRRELTVS